MATVTPLITYIKRQFHFNGADESKVLGPINQRTSRKSVNETARSEYLTVLKIWRIYLNLEGGSVRWPTPTGVQSAVRHCYWGDAGGSIPWSHAVAGKTKGWHTICTYNGMQDWCGVCTSQCTIAQLTTRLSSEFRRLDLGHKAALHELHIDGWCHFALVCCFGTNMT